MQKIYLSTLLRLIMILILEYKKIPIQDKNEIYVSMIVEMILTDPIQLSGVVWLRL
jgi:hypothetical protein